MVPPAIFVVFEGVEGSGKSTQAWLLKKRFEHAGWPAVLTFEPGGTHLGEQVRSLLLADSGRSLRPRAELLLFEAARAQLVDEVIEPALQRGQSVICDRFAPSSLAYQGIARGLGLDLVQAVNTIATDGRQADLVVLLDLPAASGLERKAPAESNRFEEELLNFHEAVGAGYRQLAQLDPARWQVVDAALPPAKIAGQVWGRIQSLVATLAAGQSEEGVGNR